MYSFITLEHYFNLLFFHHFKNYLWKVVLFWISSFITTFWVFFDGFWKIYCKTIFEYFLWFLLSFTILKAFAPNMVVVTKIQESFLKTCIVVSWENCVLNLKTCGSNQKILLTFGDHAMNQNYCKHQHLQSMVWIKFV